MLYRFRFLLIATLVSCGLYAQDCNYQLVLEDSFGDGWDGAELIVRIDGVTETYTITDDPDIDNGSRRVIFLPVSDGQTIELGFVEGAFANEHSVSLLDNDDVALFADGNPITEGDSIFSTVVSCVTCVTPAANSIEFFRLRSTSIDYRFNAAPAASDPLYLIEYRIGDDYDPATDDDGLEILTVDTTGRITDLVPDTSYSFWISTICRAEDDTTRRNGPFVFETQKRADVGITALMSPVSGCNLGSEEVTIGITNFGGEPQQFFNVDFSINGQPGGVSRPQDGIFTGIVGVDSTEFFTFDVRSLLSAPGRYEFSLWTDLEGDEDPSNDTLTLTVIHTPLITELPYVENFEGDDGFWLPTSEEGAGDNSWAWGQPDGAAFNQAPQGDFAWATGLASRYNNNERSYLHSPCFDLSALEDDPLFSAVLRMNIERNFDRFTLEMTTDGGENWELIETGPETFNWYNNAQLQFWTDNGGFPGGGPTMVSAVLDGAAGNEIQLRFLFFSDGSVTREGILVDAVSLTERYTDDLAAVTGDAISATSCGSEQDTVVFRFTNRGTEFASGFDLNYRVNGGAVVTEVFPGELAPGQTANYRFSTPFNSTTMVTNRIEAWTALETDQLVRNDTAVYDFRSLTELPFLETFEEGGVPGDWDIGPAGIGQPFGTPSRGIAENVWNSVPELLVTTSNYGLVEVGDELFLDLFFRDFASGEPFTDSILVELRVYPDCSDAFQLLDAFVARGDTSLVHDLSVYAGRSLQFELLITHVTGDVNVLVDNIGVIRCTDLSLSARTVGVSAEDVADGSATVTPSGGNEPFTYLWSTGDTLATVDSLAFGDYSVTVTDAFGCSASVTFMVDLIGGTDRPGELLAGLSLFPNPTDGEVTLRIDLPTANDLSVSLYDLNGRELRRRKLGRLARTDETFDFNDLPAGIYLLRVATDRSARTLRVVRN